MELGDETTFVRLAGQKGGAAFASLQEALQGPQIEPALLLRSAVALGAILGEERGEVVRVVGLGGQGFGADDGRPERKDENEERIDSQGGGKDINLPYERNGGFLRGELMRRNSLRGVCTLSMLTGWMVPAGEFPARSRADAANYLSLLELQTAEDSVSEREGRGTGVIDHGLASAGERTLREQREALADWLPVEESGGPLGNTEKSSAARLRA